MATETVTPNQSINEQIEKKVNEEVKAVEQEIVSPSKENGADVEEKPKTEELASPEAPVTKSEEKTEDKPVDPPAVVPVEKVDDVPVLDVQAVDVQKVIEDCNPEPDVSAVPVPAIEAVEKEPEEDSKLSDAPVAAAVEAVDKVEEVLPTPEPEEVPELETKIIEQPESVAEVEEKAHEQPEVIKEVEGKSELIEPKESLGVEIEKDEAESQEDTKFSEEKISTDQRPVASESFDAVIATNLEAPSDPKDGEVSVIPDVVKTADIDVGTVEEVKQPETTKIEDVSDVVEGSATEASLDVGKVEEQEEEKDVKVAEDIEEKNVKVEELKQPEATKTEDASDSNSATEVTEKSFEGEKASRDVEVVPDEKKEECAKDDVDTSLETSKDRDVEEKTDVVDTPTTTPTPNTTTVNEPVGEPKELVSEEKAKATVEIGADKLDKAAEVVEEIAKSDAPNLESSKDVTDTKTEGDLPKQEVPPKTTQKQSNNIMSKVKQSIVKVKKAIIGKSPSSKTISTEAKDDLKVK
ncbi:hypothetical protein BVC80_1543g37 [Macleaya cordata]|uniref:Uncharacterized protein n=1 Tax=Macleaya cordata TaxID=56857 RepID=A0A200R1M7_MACCD|nr:hypothetical protein BVC80_1543g37 [Macleaya cordata]